MGITAIMGDENFEKTSTGTQVWVVAGRYDFDKDTFDQIVVVNRNSCHDTMKNASTGTMGVLNGGTSLSEDNVKGAYLNTASTGTPDAGSLYAFGGCDKTIGKIKTSGKIDYYAIVTEQDLSIATVTLGA